VIIFLMCLICGVNVNNLCLERIDAIYLDDAHFCVPLKLCKV